MRRIIVLSMITLDGVMQSPGSPTEDPSGGFQYGGWVAPYDDEVSDRMMARLMQPSDLLLGRITFQIWENYWPRHAHIWPGINEVTKYVFSNSMDSSEWKPTVFLKNLADIKKLKDSDGSEIKVWGSGKLVQLLLKNDLVDELWLMIHPLTLGKGKKLFEDGPIPAAFTLAESMVTGKGVILANYQRAGEVKTGTIGA
jgi:dihydrofolate reductase